jgi:hypothetical protein
LWLFGVRSKILPEGGDVFGLLTNFLGGRLQELREAIEFAKGMGEMRRDREAQERWKELYRDFCNVPPGRLGVFFVRAAPTVMRMASLFALADKASVVQLAHLEAAVAIWEHSARSLRFMFQSDVDPRAEKLLAQLRAVPEGLTKTQIIHEVFSRNLDTSIINDLLTRLLAYRQILKIGYRPDSCKIIL